MRSFEIVASSRHQEFHYLFRLSLIYKLQHQEDWTQSFYTTVSVGNKFHACVRRVLIFRACPFHLSLSNNCWLKNDRLRSAWWTINHQAFYSSLTGAEQRVSRLNRHLLLEWNFCLGYLPLHNAWYIQCWGHANHELCESRIDQGLCRPFLVLYSILSILRSKIRRPVLLMLRIGTCRTPKLLGF